MTHLKTFYSNTGERDEVKAFMLEVLGELAVERTFNGEEVGGIKDAKECIDRMFDKLEELYGEKPEVIITNSK